MSTQQPRAICRLLSVTIPCCLALALSTVARAGTWHVDDSRPNCAGDGTGWPTAFQFLQDALLPNNLDFEPGDTIKVAQGTYYPDESCGIPNGSNARTDSFVLPADITLEGGYIGWDDADPNQRDPNMFVTILSGDLLGNDGPGPFEDNDENSIHVVRFDTDFEGPSGAFILVDGFTITAGNADDGFEEGQLGGGVLISAGTGGNAGGPLFRNCSFIGNRARGAGGAVGGWKIGVTLEDCLFQNNKTDAVPFDFPGGQLLENTGGGAVSISGSLQLVECRIFDNVSLGVAGGVEVVLGFGTVINCEFRRNKAGIAAGTAGGAGGGAHLSGGELTNCLFFDNTALGTGNSDGGGGLKVTGGGTIYNCTFAKNDSSFKGGGARVGSGSKVRNSIFWDNTASVQGGVLWDKQLDGVACPEYCCIKDYSADACNCPANGVDCSDTIALDPKFVNLLLGNLRLSCDSPCVDSGNPAEGGNPACRDPDAEPPPPPPDLIRCDDFDVDDDSDFAEATPDLDADAVGNFGIRVLDGRIDMGAYELITVPPCPWDCQAAPSGAVDVPDLLALLGAWGGPPLPGTTCDLDGSGVIAVPDLLALLAHWGSCPACSSGGAPTPPLQEEIEAAGLVWPDDWDDFEECMMECNEEDKENYLCWMDHYLGTCTGEICDPDPCPDYDPFGGPHVGLFP